MSATRLCLVRHGETAWNAEGRVQGQLDVPLSEVGHAQARAVAAALALERFDAIYASDLARVRQTAAPAAARLGLPVALDAALRERHYGMFERLTYAEVKQRYPAEYARFRDKDPEFDFVTGESLAGFAARALECVERLAARHAGQSILVFTHGGVLEMVYRRATGMTLSSPREFEIPNAALNRVEALCGEWRVTAWAEIAHLERALDDLPG
ncbi:MAG TPA: histidine phosphatase family protein [Burkholderiales bacterium]|nr:histidine phosphatase family protein [Burkholderiales bacterium]